MQPRHTFSSVTERNLPATMRDGTVLRADVHRPAAPGRFPTLLCRTPYDKASERRVEIGRKFAERGFVVVSQDVRGRYASEGELKPGFYSADHCDAEDGYDTVEWAAALPWSDGNVGAFGNSYNGWTQWELAHTAPPHLAAMMPQGIAANLLDREMSGVLRLGRVLWWTVNTMAPDVRRRAGERWGPRETEEAERLWEERDRSKWLWHLPLTEIPDHVLSGMAPHWRSWLADHATDHFGFLEKHRLVEVPALITTGWNDQQIGAIKHFTGMSENAKTKNAREGTRLIVGPWTHTETDWVAEVGQMDFGPEAVRDYGETVDLWFSRWLKGERNEVDDWPRVQLFVMGANRWRTSDRWPLPNTAYTDFYLHSGGCANTADGDGSLSRETPGDEPADTYVYHPRDPVMTLYTPSGQNEPQDQGPLDGRNDILTYSTQPLEKPMEVTGPITMRLWASSSAPDTDFVVKLQDVWPNGLTQELCYGIVRARYRESFEDPSLIEPGRPYEYTIQVNPTSNLFQPGHSIRVDITSSDFPNFDRNHNTGGNDYAEETLVAARQTIHHDSARPSRITLPVIPA